MVSPLVVVLDYGSGNVHSAVKAVEAAGARVELTADRGRVMAADGLLVPGVGAFRAVMDALRAVRGDELVDRRLAGGRAVMGICVGQQIMFTHGEEHGDVCEGLAEWPGAVTALRAATVPHMGWNTVEAPSDSVLFEGLHDERFYFVHSYAAHDWSLEVTNPKIRTPRVSWSEHGERFVAAVENGPLTSTQFHPEKSGSAGLALLGNWLRTL